MRARLAEPRALAGAEQRPPDPTAAFCKQRNCHFVYWYEQEMSCEGRSIDDGAAAGLRSRLEPSEVSQSLSPRTNPLPVVTAFLQQDVLVFHRQPAFLRFS